MGPNAASKAMQLQAGLLLLLLLLSLADELSVGKSDILCSRNE